MRTKKNYYYYYTCIRKEVIYKYINTRPNSASEKRELKINLTDMKFQFAKNNCELIQNEIVNFMFPINTCNRWLIVARNEKYYT